MEWKFTDNVHVEDKGIIRTPSYPITFPLLIYRYYLRPVSWLNVPSYPQFSHQKRQAGGSCTELTRNSVKQWRGSGLLGHGATASLSLTALFHSEPEHPHLSLWMWISCGLHFSTFTFPFLTCVVCEYWLGTHQTAQGTQHFTWNVKYYKTESWETWQGINQTGQRERKGRERREDLKSA